MSEESGIVRLDELPEKEIYVEVYPEFITFIEKKIREKSSIKEFSIKANVSARILEHWLRKESLLRLDVLKVVTKFFHINLNDLRIVALRGAGGKKIKNPKLPFNFATKSGVRIVAAILCDGSLTKRGLFYSNSNETLLKEFIKNTRDVFGEVEPSIRSKSDNPKVKIVELLQICGTILEKVGVKRGAKVKVNPNIPSFIFKLEKEKIVEFISQVIDDEGSISKASRHLGIHLATEVVNSTFNLLEDIRRLLMILGIESVAYKESEYTSKRGPNRLMWRIEIHSFERLEKLYSILNLKNKDKLRDFEELLKSKKLTVFPRKKCKEIFLSVMREIEKEKGYFTSIEVAQKVNRKLGHVQNMLNKFFKQGLIVRIESSYAGNVHSFAKYGVKK